MVKYRWWSHLSCQEVTDIQQSIKNCRLMAIGFAKNRKRDFAIRHVNLARLFIFFFSYCIFSLLLVNKCSISWCHVWYTRRDGREMDEERKRVISRAIQYWLLPNESGARARHQTNPFAHKILSFTSTLLSAYLEPSIGKHIKRTDIR